MYKVRMTARKESLKKVGKFLRSLYLETFGHENKIKSMTAEKICEDFDSGCVIMMNGDNFVWNYYVNKDTFIVRGGVK